METLGFFLRGDVVIIILKIGGESVKLLLLCVVLIGEGQNCLLLSAICCLAQAVVHKRSCTNLCHLHLQEYLQLSHHTELVLSSFDTEVSFRANEENGAKSLISGEITALAAPSQKTCYCIRSQDEYIFVDLLLKYYLTAFNSIILSKS